MRKSTVRSGMRMLLAALLLILLASFYHAGIAGLFTLSPAAAQKLYGQVIFWAAALGGFGVMVAVTGLVRSPDRSEPRIRLFPLLLMIAAVMALYFYLMASSFTSDRYERLEPGETITI